MDGEPTKNDAAPAGGATEKAAPEDFRAKYLYAQAEIENTKRRMQRRADDAAQAVRRRVLLRFLPVLDNLERALTYGGFTVTDNLNLSPGDFDPYCTAVNSPVVRQPRGRTISLLFGAPWSASASPLTISSPPRCAG